MARLNRRTFLKAAGAAAAGLVLPPRARAGQASAAPRDARPNIVFILADDMGVGDVSLLGGERTKIMTPHIDRIGREGVIFSDAHSASAVCTPTRYGILTGRYPWRSRLKSGVLGGWSPRLIEEGRLTVPALLKQHGYHTACIGKWHLGMDWPARDGPQYGDKIEPGGDVTRVDYTRPIRNGPNAVGFDYYYGISASLDMPPYIFIENDRTAGLPTAQGTAAEFLRAGPREAGFRADRVLRTLAGKAAAYVRERAATGQPFFLHLCLASPHTPIAPREEFVGKSGLTKYLDFCLETDWAVGEVLLALDETGAAASTLVIFTADNGCSPAANVKELEARGHFPSHIRRGYKADIWEGGHRVPFVARWRAVVQPGRTCDETICLNDLLATAAAIVGGRLPDNAGEDSVSLLPALSGERLDAPLREATVHQAISGGLSIRQGRWKLEMCPGSGGWSAPRDNDALALGLRPVQLYDLAADPAEKTNVAAEHPEVVQRLRDLLAKYVCNGRSTPGAPQKNTPPDTWPGIAWMKEG